MLKEGEGPLGMLYSVTFSPDGTQMATGSSVIEDEVITGGEIILWDALTHRAVRTIRLPDFWLSVRPHRSTRTVVARS